MIGLVQLVPALTSAVFIKIKRLISISLFCAFDVFSPRVSPGV